MPIVESFSAQLDADVLQEAIGAQLIGREVVVVEETTSTNDLAYEMALRDAIEGTAVFAEAQTAARGRHGKKWISTPRAGVYFSILLRPMITAAESIKLTAWLADCVAATIGSQLQLPAVVKKPNDVYMGGRKVCGVLVEMRAVAGARHVAIAGVGININQREEDFREELRGRAASLSMFTGSPVDRQRFATALVRELDRTYPELFG